MILPTLKHHSTTACIVRVPLDGCSRDLTMGGGYSPRPIEIRAEFTYKAVRRGIVSYCPGHCTVRDLTNHLTVELRQCVDPHFSILEGERHSARTLSLMIRYVSLKGVRVSPNASPEDVRLNPDAQLASIPELQTSTARVELDLFECDPPSEKPPTQSRAAKVKAGKAATAAKRKGAAAKRKAGGVTATARKTPLVHLEKKPRAASSLAQKRSSRRGQHPGKPPATSMAVKTGPTVGHRPRAETRAPTGIPSPEMEPSDSDSDVDIKVSDNDDEDSGAVGPNDDDMGALDLGSVGMRKSHEDAAKAPLLERLHRWKMSTAPHPRIADFMTDPGLPVDERRALVHWNRSLEDATSPAMLQIKFSFSVPTDEAIRTIAREAEGRGVVSAGAGAGYWEWLLQEAGIDVFSFDKNSSYVDLCSLIVALSSEIPALTLLPLWCPTTPHYTHSYPESGRYTDITTGGPEQLATDNAFGPQGIGRVLLLGWPDLGEESDFGRQCVDLFSGSTIIHIGELYGATLGEDVWGQTTTRACQEHLSEHFRRVATVPLPRWPGHLDELTVWRRVVGRVVAKMDIEDGGGETVFCHLQPGPPPHDK
jgi:hypothetical protein